MHSSFQLARSQLDIRLTSYGFQMADRDEELLREILQSHVSSSVHVPYRVHKMRSQEAHNSQKPPGKSPDSHVFIQTSLENPDREWQKKELGYLVKELSIVKKKTNSLKWHGGEAGTERVRFNMST